MVICPLYQRSSVTPSGSVDDEVALEGGCLDFQRTQRSGNVPTAASFLGEIL